MKIIPLLHIKKGEIVNSNYNSFKNIKYLLDKYREDFLYIFDHDGIIKNRPNLCIFQKLSKNHELWVDAGPRDIGDVVDSIIAGASKITVRDDFIDLSDILSSNDILEEDIYINISSDNDLEKKLDVLVPFDSKINYQYEFKYQSPIKNSVNNKFYAYVSSKEDIQKLKKLDIKGFLIDIERIEEYKNIGF